VYNDATNGSLLGGSFIVPATALHRRRLSAEVSRAAPRERRSIFS
jgi:hypothetical protein